MMYNIRSGAIRWQIPNSDGNSNFGSNSHLLRHSTGYVRFHIDDLFQKFSSLGTYVYAKGNTHLHTHTQRETGVMTIRKICKADLPYNNTATIYVILI